MDDGSVVVNEELDMIVRNDMYDRALNFRSHVRPLYTYS
jgi:hypothetical protein